MMELFIVGTFWFWALLAAEIILLFVFIENENGIGATMSVLAFAALLQWCGNVDLIAYIRANPTFIVSCALAYFACGAVWGIIKWWIFCRDRLEEYEDARAEFLKKKGITGTKVVPPELREEWKRNLEDRYGKNLSATPQVRDHKSQIMRWMTFWVISIIWSFIHDFVTRIFRTIYQKMHGMLQGISDKMFGSIKEDLEVPVRDEE